MNQSNKSPISPTTKAKGCAKKKVVKQSTINITMLEFHFLEETTYPFFKTGFSSKPTLAGARIKKGKIKIDGIIMKYGSTISKKQMGNSAINILKNRCLT